MPTNGTQMVTESTCLGKHQRNPWHNLGRIDLASRCPWLTLNTLAYTTAVSAVHKF